MSFSPNLTLLLSGAVIGLGTALLGGFIEYWFSLRPNGNQAQRRLPGCLFYFAGGLVLAGAASLLVSFFVYGAFRPALTIGAGVISGFFIGFVILFGIWLLLER